MKVLHIAGGTPASGAGRGVLWLHEGLLGQGVESQVVFQKGDEPHKAVRVFNDSFTRTARQSIRSNLDNIPLRVYPRASGLFSCGLAGNDVRNWPEYQDADIVHLHWINQAMMSTRGIGKITKPMVWTLRDMWPLTGGCHYDLGCDKFRDKCGSCPVLGSKSSTDLSTLLQRQKSKHFKRANIHLVAISEWMGQCARDSANFSENTPLTVIPNCVDVDQYRPVDVQVARNILGLPAERKIVLCGAQSLKSAYKGFAQFLAAVPAVDNDALFVFFGRLDNTVLDGMNCDYRNLGFVHDSTTLRLAYSAADVFVAPSIQEAFGKTLIESQACGTPVVCFDSAGPKDIVNHQVDGYKAAPEDAADLAAGINWILSLSDERQLDMAIAARNNVVENFGTQQVAGQYQSVYEGVMASKRT